MTRRSLAAAVALAVVALACSRDRKGASVAASSAAPAPATATVAGALDEWHTLRTADGRERRYFVHAAPSTTPRPRPLLLVLHGGGGNAEGAQTTTFTHAAADRLGVVAVYPEGVVERVLGRPMATWNGGYCCGKARQEGVDDSAFLVAVLDHLAGRVSFDRSRVFATGISNGGIMATRLACERPDRIAGISTVGSPGYVGGCKDPKPMPVQLIHGTADDCALYGGGAECGGCWERATRRWLGIPLPARHFACTSVADQAAFWRKVNGCSDRETVTHDKGAARCVEYADCTSKKPVSVCTVTGGGHTWPGGVRGCDEKLRACRAYAEVTGPISQDLDANRAMIEFFERARSGVSGSDPGAPRR